jgi:flagellin
MRINTNISALNAQRIVAGTNAAVSSSMAKLSSGFRINRAADDAAGLGIANKLRADVRSLTQASRNTEQANSVLQIADGATGTISKILERMKELATQAASDSTDDSGRTRLHAEFDQLRSEVSRTVSSTKFQGKELLSGSFGSKFNETYSDIDGVGEVGYYGVEAAGAGVGTYTLTTGAIGATTAAIATLTMGGVSQTASFTTGAVNNINFSQFGITVKTSNAVTGAGLNADTIAITAANGGSFMIGSSGDYTGTTDNLTLDAMNLSVTADGASDGVIISTSSLSSVLDAKSALFRIDSAISNVNAVIGKIGAYQNRIENAASNLKTTIQNYSAAESVIRDVDMAEEMTTFSKNQILQQAGMAMLAQANSSSQSVLSLLRG